MITVILTYYQRPEIFPKVLMSWVTQKLVDEIIICDNSGQFHVDAQDLGYDIKVINFSQNMGTQVKYPMALLAKNEWVIYADDDIIAKPGLAEDLYKHKDGGGAVGIIGRIFNGKSYYTSKGIRGENVDKLTKVDWLGGGCTLAHRQSGAVEVAKCPANEIDDWWWEEENLFGYGTLRNNLWVIPTNKYEFINPQEGIHTTEKCKKLREEYYAKTQLGKR